MCRRQRSSSRAGASAASAAAGDGSADQAAAAAAGTTGAAMGPAGGWAPWQGRAAAGRGAEGKLGSGFEWDTLSGALGWPSRGGTDVLKRAVSWDQQA